MRKSSSVSIIIAIAVSPEVWGADLGWLSTRGLYGSLEYGYAHESSSNTNNRSTQDTMTQNYLLGTTGSVYSPNLFSYLLEGAFVITDTKNKTSSTEMESSSEILNYRMNADIIRATNFPFLLYNEKSFTPYSSISSDASFSYDEVSERSGISGSMKLPYFLLNYKAESSQMQREENFSDEARDNQDYSVSIYKDNSYSRFSAVYNERFREYLRDDRRLTTHQDWTDHTRDGSANWAFDIDKTLRIASSMSYMESDYVDMTNLSGSFSVDWRPTISYNAGMNVMVNTMEAGESQNDNYTLNAHSNYQVTPEFSTTQNLSLYSMQGEYSDMKMETLSVGGNYFKLFDEGSTFNSSATLMGKAEQNKVNGDFNSSLPDRNMYSYNLNVGGSTLLEPINSRLMVGLMYDNSYSSLDETTKRFSGQAVLSSTILYNLMHNLSASYILDKSGYYSQGQIVARNIEVESVDNALLYSQDIGYVGKLTLGGGVAYTSTQVNDSESLTRIFPHAEGSFLYRFWNSVQLQSNMSVSQDSVSDLTNYLAYMGLNYSIRRFLISLEGKYLLQTGGAADELAQSSVFFKIKRTF